ncbi:MAG: hypothetical protein FWC34_11655 [Bacteroidetes bacterium]|nr:hypothetical protein [Bacteroidota bacterium]MCL2302069.1 hypothetical protein [Lentimicrobiaceae bacterium]
MRSKKQIASELIAEYYDQPEKYFFKALAKDRVFANEQFDWVEHTEKIAVGDEEAELGILLFNDKSVAIIEIDYFFAQYYISVRRIIAQVETFKKFYPMYKNHNIYLGVASMIFRKGVKERLHRNGIATLCPVGKKLVVYDKEVKVF